MEWDFEGDDQTIDPEAGDSPEEAGPEEGAQLQPSPDPAPSGPDPYRITEMEPVGGGTPMAAKPAGSPQDRPRPQPQRVEGASRVKSERGTGILIGDTPDGVNPFELRDNPSGGLDTAHILAAAVLGGFAAAAGPDDAMAFVPKAIELAAQLDVALSGGSIMAPVGAARRDQPRVRVKVAGKGIMYYDAESPEGKEALANGTALPRRT